MIPVSVENTPIEVSSSEQHFNPVQAFNPLHLAIQQLETVQQSQINEHNVPVEIVQDTTQPSVQVIFTSVCNTDQVRGFSPFTGPESDHGSGRKTGSNEEKPEP